MDRPRSPRAVLVAVIATGLIVPAVGGAPTAVGNDESAVSSSLTSPPLQANNSSVRHVDPESASTEGDTGALRSWLAERMDRALVDCSQGLQVGDYDACNRTDRQYPEWVGMYAEVTGRSDGSNASESAASGTAASGNGTEAQSFENARENQTQLAATVREFRETYDQYREARRNGDNARARELARKLTRLSKRTDNNTAALRRIYRRASLNSSANFSGAIDSVNEIDRNVTRTASQVREQSFVNTTLRVTADGEDASFLDPLPVSGLLASENGTVLANEPIRIEIGNRTINTTTDTYGGFTVPYRPTWLPVDAEEVTVRYVPANDSALLGSSATLPIDTTAVTPTVRATAEPTTVGYNDSFTVSGSVSAEGVPADDVPVVVTIDGEPVNATWTGDETIRTTNDSTVTTGSDGRFALTTRLPAGVAAGEQQARVSIPWQNRSLVGANATRSAAIRPTATRLDATGEQTAGREIRVTGRLTARDGSSIRGGDVTVSAGGEVLGRATTTENGSYIMVALVPQETLTQDGRRPEATVTVAYAGSGTNLEPARTTLDVPIEGLSVTDRWTVLVATLTDAVTGALDAFPRTVEEFTTAVATTPPTVIVLTSAVVTLLVSLLSAWTHWWWTQRPAAPDESVDGESENTIGSTDDGAPVSGVEEVDDGTSLFSPADWLFAGRPDEAIERAYAIVRARMGEEVGISPSRTHREFYDACRDASLGGARLAALRTIVEAYEHAAFASGSLSERVARKVLDRLALFDDEEPDGQDADRNQSGDV
jgi:hypothetical protein